MASLVSSLDGRLLSNLSTAMSSPIDKFESEQCRRNQSVEEYQMRYQIRDVTCEDRYAVIDIFNYYIKNSFAAFPETEVGYGFFDLLKNASQGYPFYVMAGDADEPLGFGLLHSYHPFPVFSRAAEATYFIRPEHARNGMGTELLKRLVQAATARGIDTLLASISSRNEASLRFHSKNGFRICGRLERIGRKNGQEFDVVWMQKFIYLKNAQ
jgi:L-amino acid N-acyltransferase YncA